MEEPLSDAECALFALAAAFFGRAAHTLPWGLQLEEADASGSHESAAAEAQPHAVSVCVIGDVVCSSLLLTGLAPGLAAALPAGADAAAHFVRGGWTANWWLAAASAAGVASVELSTFGASDDNAAVSVIDVPQARSHARWREPTVALARPRCWPTHAYATK